MSDEREITQTEAANRCFLERAQQIPNVTVHITGGQTLVEQSFLVEVPALRSEEADRVHELEGEIYRAFPRTQTRIRVRGRRELTVVPDDMLAAVGEEPS